MSRALSFLDTVNSYFDKAAALTDYAPGLLDQIRVCNSVYAFQFPIRRQGGYEVIAGWRAKHSPMLTAYRQIRDQWKRDSRVEDLRTAAFPTALHKVAATYLELGIFPWPTAARRPSVAHGRRIAEDRRRGQPSHGGGQRWESRASTTGSSSRAT